MTVQHTHLAVPRCLGEDRCGGNFCDKAITFNHCTTRQRDPRYMQAIDHDFIPPSRQVLHPLNGALHRQQRRLENIDRINFCDARLRDAKGERLVLNFNFQRATLF